ncbi:hypothetical protein JR316_0000480 [Psilocybe cubensis]|uniref:Uncharacterized protein n=2 Tax=Psilocybe cubensis TaxID=181762 RepID=A0ACB8HG05_PSICU|nr:hypothetical protein JR316_0000480 [Psilocybe cubensis]KAH9486416.1 hypothetical protein JR316_0000480 [Psilocybe cubensis]
MRSSALCCLTSLRFRIPARPVARALCNVPPSPSSSLPLPDLEFIDLSNTAILENEIDSLLVRLPCLKHILLDNCNIFRGEQHPNDWRAFGKRCALIGVQRSKEREKVWKEYLELRDASRLISEVNGTGGSSNEGRKIKPGRRGLATATISLRGAEIVTSAAPRRPLIPADTPTTVPALGPRSTTDQGSSRTPKKKNEGSESIIPQASPAKPVSMPFPSLVSASLPDIQAHYNKKGQKSSPVPPSGSQESSETRQSVPLYPKPSPPAPKSSEEAEIVTGQVHSKKSRNNSTSKNTTKRAKKQERVRVLPPLPSLISLCVTLPPPVEENDQLAIQNHFGEGWVEGIKQLQATRARLRTSAANGVRVMRFAVHSDPLSTKPDSSESEGSDMDSKGSNKASEGGAISSNIGLHGLVDIDRTDPDAFGTYLEGSTTLQAPILCFAGPGIGGQHMDNCGHSVAWKIMKDDT